NLVAAEQFSLGGPDSVRGYPLSEYLGDYGYNLSAELRVKPAFLKARIPFTNDVLSEIMQFAFFIDHGGIFLKRPSLGEAKNEYLTGAGFGFRFAFNKDFYVRVDCGFPIGEKEPSTDYNNTWYVQAVKHF
ncbi:MAG: BamA/TamA family outer membrane protein, partial [Candidatus Omnitrophica bacterium]|nr:BamA/TamA family outer membrane protein [Candidatus Omnitrophota bacterium]